MLAQVQDQAAARDLPVERSVVIEAMLPIEREAEKSEIELVRLGDVEDAQDRRDLEEFDRIGHQSFHLLERCYLQARRPPRPRSLLIGRLESAKASAEPIGARIQLAMEASAR